MAPFELYAIYHDAFNVDYVKWRLAVKKMELNKKDLLKNTIFNTILGNLNLS